MVSKFGILLGSVPDELLGGFIVRVPLREVGVCELEAVFVCWLVGLCLCVRVCGFFVRVEEDFRARLERWLRRMRCRRMR